MAFARVYPAYLAKAQKKGRTKEEVDEIIRWLTGYTTKQFQRALDTEVDFRTFFADARSEPESQSAQGRRLWRADEEIATGEEARVPDKLWTSRQGRRWRASQSLIAMAHRRNLREIDVQPVSRRARSSRSPIAAELCSECSKEPDGATRDRDQARSRGARGSRNALFQSWPPTSPAAPPRRKRRGVRRHRRERPCTRSINIETLGERRDSRRITTASWPGQGRLRVVAVDRRVRSSSFKNRSRRSWSRRRRGCAVPAVAADS